MKNTIENIVKATSAKTKTSNNVTFIYNTKHCIIAIDQNLYIGDNNAEITELPNGKTRMRLHRQPVSETEAIAFLNA